MDHAGDTNPARFSQYFKPRGKCTPRVQLFEATSHARRLTSPPPGRAGQTFDATDGLDPEDGQPRERFLSGGAFHALVGARLSPLQSLHLPQGLARRHVRPGGQHGTDRMAGLVNIVQAFRACIGESQGYDPPEPGAATDR